MGGDVVKTFSSATSSPTRGMVLMALVEHTSCDA
jgi:hypothetical protein